MSTEYLNNKLLETAICNYLKTRQQKIKMELIMEDLEVSFKKREKNKLKQNYNLEEYRKIFLESKINYEIQQSNLANAFYTLAEHLARYAKDIITDSDDAIQESVLTCFEKIDKFHPNKGKAFSYFTSVMLNSSRQMYRSYKGYKLLKERYKDFLNCKIGETIIKNGKEINISED
jgi:DNA-directed RNA polymerase specialized sigma subunit